MLSRRWFSGKSACIAGVFAVLCSPPSWCFSSPLADKTTASHNLLPLAALMLGAACILGLVCKAALATKRRQKRQRTRTQLQRTAGLQTLFDSLPYYAWLKDEQNLYVVANRFFLDGFGLDSHEIEGKTDFDIWPADIAFRLSKDSSEATSKTATVDTGDYIISDGNEERQFRSVHFPIIDAQGKILGTAGTTRDITRKKRAEEQLKISEEKFSKFFYSSPNWLLVATVEEGRYIDVNDAFCKMTGYSRQEVIGKTSIEFGLWRSPEDRKQVVSMLNSKGKMDTFPCSFRMRDGSLRDFLWSAVVIELDGEKCALSTLMDVTEFEQARRDRERLNEQLNHAQKMKAIGTLAGGIAHDLNNLLTGIKGRNSLLMTQEQLQPAVRQGLEEIDAYADSAASLTRQLLGFARGGKYEVTSTDVNRLIEETATMFGRTRKELTISLSLDENAGAILADRHQIEQVFLNLYINAWQAMEERRGGLRIETSMADVDENSGVAAGIEPGRYVKISIADTGEGMDKDTVDRIFEPFFSTKKRGQGTGLGLASVYGIVKNHHGSVEVESVKGEGTTFTLYFPAGKDGGSSKARTSATGPVRGQGKILLVDDEEYIAELSRELLSSLGYEVVSVTSAGKAIEIFQAEDAKFDLVIFDMIMPEMDGEQLFARLQHVRPEVKFLLSSGYSIDGQAARIMSQGCDGFIQKPFGLQEVSDKIKAILKP